MKTSCKFLLIIFLLSYSELFGQTNTSSPYSMFGIGDIKPLGFGRCRSLGGAGIALASDESLNNINPASYYSIDSLAFKLETGVDMKMSKFTNGPQSQYNNNINFSYIAVGFRNKSWWANSLGIAPFSSVGNDINTKKNIEGASDYYDVNLQGTGGLNQFYWANSFKLLPKLALGINFSFLFGSINQTETITANSFSGSLKTEDKIYLNKLYLNYGFQYSFNISNKVQATIGGVLGLPCKLNLNHDVTITDNNSSILEDSTVKQSTFTIPAYRGLGIALKFSNKLILTGDCKFYDWSGTKPFQSNIKLVNSENFILGIEYMPANSSLDPYFKKIKYRVGGYFNNSYMMINGQQLKEKGISLGLGIPVIKNKLFISLAYEMGTKGVNGNHQGIINENNHNFMINFSFNELWFSKPKFD